MRTNRFSAPYGGELVLTEIGFGTAPLGNLYRELPEDTARATLDAAWRNGLRYLDTAPQYGHGLSETRLASFLEGRARADFVISTKVGRLLEPSARGEFDPGAFVNPSPNRILYDYSYDAVMRSYDDSRRRLGLERIDVLYVHDVDAFTHGSREASDRRVAEFMAGGYRALEALRDAGEVLAIGAGVNEWEVCETLTGLGDFDLFLLAGRYTLLEQNALESFLPLCEMRGIGIVLGGPYNSGILATGPVPGAKYNYEDASAEVLERVSAIEAVCRDHGVPLAQAALQFPLAHPSVVSVIPGAQAPDEVDRNVEAYRAHTPDTLWSDLKSAGLVRHDAPTPPETRGASRSC